MASSGKTEDSPGSYCSRVGGMFSSVEVGGRFQYGAHVSNLVRSDRDSSGDQFFQ